MEIVTLFFVIFCIVYTIMNNFSHRKTYELFLQTNLLCLLNFCCMCVFVQVSLPFGAIGWSVIVAYPDHSHLLLISTIIDILKSIKAFNYLHAG